MRRREFITALAGTAITWPVVVGAQQSAIPVIGFLDSRSTETVGNRLRAFRQGLGEDGYSEGRNVAIEYRWAKISWIDYRNWRVIWYADTST